MSDPDSMSEVFADLRKVARGLSLVFTSYVVRILSAVFGVILAVCFQDAPALVITIALIGCGAFLIGMFMGIRGRALCLAVPEGSKAKSYIWGSVTLDVIGVAMIIADAVLEYPKGLAALLTGVGELLSLLFFVVFLRHTAELIQNDYLASRAKAIILNAALICASFIALFVVLVYVPNRAKNGGLALVSICSSMTLFGMLLVVLIQYANLIRNLGRSIERMVDAASRYVEPLEDALDIPSDTFR